MSDFIKQVQAYKWEMPIPEAEKHNYQLMLIVEKSRIGKPINTLFVRIDNDFLTAVSLDLSAIEELENRINHLFSAIS
jgi:hypothetical protein